MTNLRAATRAGLAALALATTFPATGAAQGLPGSERGAARAELQSALTLLESSASSPAYSERTRAKARQQSQVVRERLTAGDFKVGDRIQIRVVGPTQLVDDTLTVGDSLILDVTGIRRIRLYGVLRSELPQVLVRDLSEVVRQVQVTAQPHMRVAVLGQVGAPGYRAVPAETLLDQLISRAGGPLPTAALNEMQLMRGDTILMEGAAMTAAISRGETLAALDIRDGDAVMIPAQGTAWDRASVLQVVSMFFTPLLTLFVLR